MNPHPSTHLEGQQEEEGLYAVESPVHEIAHEEVVCLRGGGRGRSPTALSLRGTGNEVDSMRGTGMDVPGAAPACSPLDSRPRP